MMTGIVHAIRDKGLRFVAGATPAAAKKTGRFAWVPGATETPPRATGTITTIWDKGYGFIGRDAEGGRIALYFHRTAVEADGFAALRRGQRVSFEEEANPGDPNHQRAVNVRPVGVPAGPPPSPREGAAR